MKFLNKTHKEIYNQLLEYVKLNFPQYYGDFKNQSGFANIFLNLTAYVNDILNFYADYNFKQTILPYTQNIKILYQLARNIYGYRIKNVTPSTCKFTLIQKVLDDGGNPNAQDFIKLAPGTIIKNQNDIHFLNQYVIDMSKYDSIQTDSQNQGYFLVSKQVFFTNGKLNTLQRSVSQTKKNYQIILPQTNIYKIYNLVDSNDNLWYQVQNFGENNVYIYQVVGQKLTYSKIQNVKKKFITRLNPDNTTSIIFGQGSIDVQPQYYQDQQSNFFDLTKNKTYGQIPKYGQVFTIKYLTSDGADSNILAGSTWQVQQINYLSGDQDPDNLKFFNLQSSYGGSWIQSISQIKRNMVMSLNTQNRMVSKQDYYSKLYEFDKQFGKIYKAFVDKKHNTIYLYVLTKTADGKLKRLDIEDQQDNLFIQNLKVYLDRYNLLTRKLYILSPNIININIIFQIITQSSSNKRQTIYKCIQKIQKMVDFQINQPILKSKFITALYQIPQVTGVKNINFILNNSGQRSKVYYDIQAATVNNVIYPPSDFSVFQVYDIDVDIKGTS